MDQVIAITRHSIAGRNAAVFAFAILGSMSSMQSDDDTSKPARNGVGKVTPQPTPTSPNQDSVVPATRQKKSTVFAVLFAAVTAVTEVVLGVLSNQFFVPEHHLLWVIGVFVSGGFFVLLNVFNVRAENGERILRWATIRKIVAGRAFAAAVAALLAASLTAFFMRHVDKPGAATAGGSATTTKPTEAPSGSAAALTSPALSSPVPSGGSTTSAARDSRKSTARPLPSSPGQTAGAHTNPAAIPAVTGATTPATLCEKSNAGELLAASRSASQRFAFTVGAGSYLGMDGSAARYSDIPRNPSECKLNFELNDNEIQPLSGSKIGKVDGNGACTPTQSAVTVDRNVPVKLCGYSSRDNSHFAVEATLSDEGIWTFDGV